MSKWGLSIHLISNRIEIFELKRQKDGIVSDFLALRKQSFREGELKLAPLFAGKASLPFAFSLNTSPWLPIACPFPYLASLPHLLSMTRVYKSSMRPCMIPLSGIYHTRTLACEQL